MPCYEPLVQLREVIQVNSNILDRLAPPCPALCGTKRLCPETWGLDPLRHRFKILVNMSRLARSQVEKAFFRNAAGNVQRVWQRPAGGDAAKPSKPARGKGGASWLRNQAALKHQETASMPSPVWTANRPNAESLKAYAACPSSPNTIRPLILNKGCLG